MQKLNKVYNQIVKVRSPARGNAISDLAELGKSCEDAGLLDEARGWYTLAITMNPLDADAQRALARLAKARTQGRRVDVLTIQCELEGLTSRILQLDRELHSRQSRSPCRFSGPLDEDQSTSGN